MFSILNTHIFFISDSFKTPSPGAYSPEKVHPQGEKHAPSYSMGQRTRYRKRKLKSAKLKTRPKDFLTFLPFSSFR